MSERAKGAGPLGYIGALEQSERDLCFQLRTIVNLCEMGYSGEAARVGRNALRGVDRARKEREHLNPVVVGIMGKQP